MQRPMRPKNSQKTANSLRALLAENERGCNDYWNY